MATIKEVKNFVSKVYPEAKRIYESRKSYINPLFVTAQAGLETGWGLAKPGNNILGITKGSNWAGKTQLLLTTEYFTVSSKQFTSPEYVVSVSASKDDKGYFRYRCYRLFRVYDTIGDCLLDHVNIFNKSWFDDARPFADDPYAFADHISDDVGKKYATGTNYAETIKQCINLVKRNLP